LISGSFINFNYAIEKIMTTIKKLNFKSLIVFCILSSVLFSCKEEKVEFQANDCKKQPAFIKNIGFDPSRSAFTTSEKRQKGIALIQINSNGDTSNGGRKFYQHPSWTTAGYMGPIVLDPQGNCFVAPIPVINLIDNPIAKQNILYKVNSQTGLMDKYLELPVKDSLGVTNPYGIVGLAYLCESSTMYVSSLQGSTRATEIGVIYAVNNQGKIIDKLDNVDAFGIGVAYVNDCRYLYYGSARTPDIYQVSLTAEGKFNSKPVVVATLSNLGERGDDKARKIRFDKTGKMEVFALEFNYNLTAPTEKQESKFIFSWNEESKKWDQVK
jgi:hypothetical protein